MKNREKNYLIGIVILIIFLIIMVIYYNKDEILTIEAKVLAVGNNYLLVETVKDEDFIVETKDNNYQIGDLIKLELTDINRNKTPFEAISKSIIKLESSNNSINKEEIINDNLDSNKDEVIESFENDKFTDEQVITYFEKLNNDLINYNDGDESFGKSLKTKFVKCIDFLFYNEEISGKTFSELTNEAKLKVLELTMSIDSKIDSKFPGYKESISETYQNIKSKIVSKYLEITTSLCNNNSSLCETAKDNFKDIKENFGITWDFIKELTKNGISNLKDWYEIWRYN